MSLIIVPSVAGVGGWLGVQVGWTYVLIGPDGTRAVINDSEDPDWIGFLDPENGVTGLERAGVRESADDLAEGDGRVHGAFRRQGLAWTLAGAIPPDDRSGSGTWTQRMDRLLRATDCVDADGTLSWQPTDGGAGEVSVKYRTAQPTRITGRRPKSFLVAGVCEKSYAESVQSHSASVVPGEAAAGGFSSPLTSPLTSSADTPDGVTVLNAGRSRAWPLLTVLGPCSNPVIRSATLGRELRIAYELLAGESLVIETDPRRRTVRLNGDPGANRYGAVDWSVSTWWGLVPGYNDVRLGVSSFSAGAALQITWKDAWG